MSIVIQSMIKIFFLKICSRLIQLTRRAEFAKKLLKVLEVKKTHVSFSLWKTLADGWK